MGHTFNTQTLPKTDEKKKNVLSKFTILCWAAFMACGPRAGHPCKGGKKGEGKKQDRNRKHGGRRTYTEWSAAYVKCTWTKC